MEGSKFNIRYDVIGRVDGYWTIQAYDTSNKPIGITVTCLNPTEVLTIFLMVNGYGYTKPDYKDEVTQDIYVEAKAS